MCFGMTVRAEQMALPEFSFDGSPINELHNVGDAKVFLGRVAMVKRQSCQAFAVSTSFTTSTLVINSSLLKFFPRFSSRILSALFMPHYIYGELSDGLDVIAIIPIGYSVVFPQCF